VLPLIGRVQRGAQANFVETRFPSFLCYGFSSMLLRLIPSIGMLLFGGGEGIALLFECFLEDEEEGLTFNSSYRVSVNLSCRSTKPQTSNKRRNHREHDGVALAMIITADSP